MEPNKNSTQSDGTFKPGEPIVVNYPGFDLAALLEARLQLDLDDPLGIFSLSPLSEPERLDDIDDTFSLSPLTSCASSPPNSPHLLPLEIPHGSHPSPATTPIVSQQQPMDPSERRKKRMKAQSRKNRKKQRKEQKENQLGFQPQRNVDAFRDHRMRSAESVQVELDPNAVPVAKTGFVGLDDGSGSSDTYRLSDLVGPDSQYNFRLQKWDGRTPMPLVNQNGTVFGILAGHPDDPNWPEVHRLAAAALEDRRDQCRIPKDKHEHRRGSFKSLRCGVSHGGGQKQPRNLSNTAANACVLEELNAMEPFRRLAGFASSVMSTWTPDLHQYYVDYLGRLYEHNPELKRTFSNSVFPATTYNFGLQTVCYRHTDYGNLPFGLCSVTALGTYDHTKGGHLVLWNCGLVIEFPPGSTILIPSGILSHSNTAISEDETRYSFTQYAAGGLFRWVENGFQKATVYWESLAKEMKVKAAEESSKRWKFGLSLLPTFHCGQGIDT